MSNVTKEVTSQDFENKISELQAIVDKLESDAGVSLEESVALFESGLKLTKTCVDELDGMQARINDLNKQLDEILSRPVLGERDE
ncbi:MAG: exodeoxyribonuclease VII small subunit [Clostridiales bacterium]|nr:exodeoxyribonuclease VII small subunit [Clostridiales bacterium]